MMLHIFHLQNAENRDLVREKRCSPPPLSLLLEGKKGDVASTFLATREIGRVSECVFRLAHFIRRPGIATPEEEPRAPPVLSIFFFPLRFESATRV